MVEYTLSRGTTSLELTPENGFYVRPGVEGLDTPPVRLSETEPADSDGSLVTNVRYAAREIVLPLHAQAAGPNEMRGLTRFLASLLNPQRGQVTLTVTHPVDSTSELMPADATDGKVAEWEASNIATTISEVSSPKRSGTVSLKVDVTGVISGNGYGGAVLPTAKRLTVAAGQSYQMRAYALTSSGTASARLLANFYTSTGSLVASEEVSVKTANATTWTSLEGVVTPPFGATKLAVEVAGGKGLFSPDLYFDDITVTPREVTREISGYLSSPLGAALGKVEGLPWRRFALQLRCPDPFFLGPTEQAISTFVNAATIYNPGDADAWPVWTAILASGFPITFTNTSIDGSPSISVDDTYSSLSINTNPRTLSVIDNATDDPAWDAIGASSVFFPLVPGENAITGTNLGGLSYIVGTFRPRWLTGW